VSFCFKRGYSPADTQPSKRQRTDPPIQDPDSDNTSGESSHTQPGRRPSVPHSEFFPFTGRSGLRKYAISFNRDLGLLRWPRGVKRELLAASRSAASWNRHAAAINCYYKFCNHIGLTPYWPIDLETLRKFVSWALTTHNLSCQSTKVYLSDLKLAHNLRGFKTDIFDDFFVKSMLKGAGNLALYTNITKRIRLIMTLHC
jgi:hypothetical protein